MKIIIIFLALAAVLYAVSVKAELKKCNVSIKGETFTLEVAATRFAQRRGLMYREHIGEREGMLFVFTTEAKRSFWMKNMQMPLDIIWLNKDKEVVSLNENVPPCKENFCLPFSSGSESMYVLEVKAGTVKALEVHIKDVIEFTLDEPVSDSE